MALDDMTSLGISVAEVLERVERSKKEKRVVQLHPNSFLQVCLDEIEGPWRSDGYRFHVWDERIRHRRVLPLTWHDHVFDLDSFVLVGGILNTDYTVTPDADGTYRIMHLPGRDGQQLEDTRTAAYAQPIQLISAGQSYNIPRFTFHTSATSVLPTATIIKKTNTATDSNPRLLVPADYVIDPVQRDKSIDQDLAWTIINDVTEKIRAHYEPHY